MITSRGNIQVLKVVNYFSNFSVAQVKQGAVCQYKIPTNPVFVILSLELIDNILSNYVGYVLGNDKIISSTKGKARGPILCLSCEFCDCFGGVVVNCAEEGKVIEIG